MNIYLDRIADHEAAPESVPAESAPAQRSRTLAVCCGVHALHDGYSDLLYILLPIWQMDFGLGYASVGIVRALYTGAMAGLQVPADFVASLFGNKMILAVGTGLSALAYLFAGVSTGIGLLALALIIGGMGASTQHPICSNLVARAFDGRRSRAALGTYNFAGDLGKMIIPVIVASLLAVLPWRFVATIIGAAGILATIAIPQLLGRDEVSGKSSESSASPEPPNANVLTTDQALVARGGFPLLLGIGILDTATRMGFLTFLPFLLKAKGANTVMIGTALSFVVAGGAAGKLMCGFLGDRLGITATVVLTKVATASGIALLLPLDMHTALVLLPIIGVALNGTSSVLYGTIPEMVAAERQQRAFGIFYTGTFGAGAIAPVIYGLFSDATGIPAVMMAVSAIVLVTLPLVWMLHPYLQALDARRLIKAK
jgi:MFS transporter, FSR family, fosmidomycin resistance protein